MLDDLISAYGSKFLVAALGVSLALLCLFIVLWLLRNRAPSPFVRGGRNRQPRLQVLDAAAIDTRRRIVLIRRDNVEHLVMIGGPTDLLIETGIGDERDFLNARAVQTQAADQEARLAPQAAPSLPQTHQGQMNPVASESALAEPIAAIERDLPRAGRQAPVSPPSPAKQVEAAMHPAERKAEAAQPVPVSLAEDRAKAELPPAAAPKNPVPPVQATPVATAPTVNASATPLARAPVPPAPVAAAVLVEAPVSAVAMTSTPPAPPPARPVEPEAPAISAFVAPERKAAPAVTASMAIHQEPTAQDHKASSGRLIDEPVTAIEPDAPVTTASSEVSADPDMAPTVDIEAARPPEQPRFEAARFSPDRPSEPTEAPATEAPAQRDLSDFERVLEEEMALHIAADPGPSRPQASTAAPIPALLPETRPDRPRLPIGALIAEPRQPATPATTNNPATPAEEPNLQNEIARIFGEMSASRNP